jgi:putative membrane protein
VDGTGPYAASRALAEGTLREGGGFWRDVLAWHHNVAPLILPRVLAFGLYAFLVSLAHDRLGWDPADRSVVEFTGAFLALMLVLRTNAGYERWWEARKLWGGIVNQSRNLVVNGLAYGPADPVWRDRFVRWTAAFSHVCRRSLRGEHTLPEVARLVGDEDAQRIAASAHMPSYVAHTLAEMLREGLERGMPAPAFRQAELQRAMLIDHVGGCERILRTRFPGIHRTMLGQLIVLYLAAFPFAVVSEGYFLEALLTLAVAYPLFALDQIARELGNPFSPRNRSHLPLDDVTLAIEETLFGLLGEPAAESARRAVAGTQKDSSEPAFAGVKGERPGEKTWAPHSGVQEGD